MVSYAGGVPASADSRPIGMFDSGFGGLTVARAAIDLLPNEDLVYLGDNARYPYGSRSSEEVRAFSSEIADFLLSRYDIKALVVACNTATAAALDDLVAELPIPVIGVIEPGVRAVIQASKRDRFAVIGTFGAIASGAYEKVVRRLSASSEVITAACPGLVEFVERGTTAGPEIELLTQRLLAPVIEADVDALLLGCTHYPYLDQVIATAVGSDVALVSSAQATAAALADLLSQNGLENPDTNRSGQQQFVSSGDIRAFTELGSRLLGPELIDAELWRPGTT